MKIKKEKYKLSDNCNRASVALDGYTSFIKSAPRKKAILLFIIALIGIIGLAGCNRSSDSSASSADDTPKSIVTTFTVIEDMAQNVAGDKALVVSITKPGAEIHEYNPTPLDIVRAQSADLVLQNGFGLERWFKKFMKKIRYVSSVVTNKGIDPIMIPGGPFKNMPNPHSWMSPKNGLVYVENIRKALVKLDPKNADTYNHNAKVYSQKIKDIAQPLHDILDRIPEQKRWLVTSEGAFSYLAKDYNMKELYLWPVNADNEGIPKQIQKVVDGIRKHNIPVGFSESTISDKPMKQVVSETNAKYGGVLYVDSLTDETGPAPTYLKLLKYDVDLIAKGFGKK